MSARLLLLAALLCALLPSPARAAEPSLRTAGDLADLGLEEEATAEYEAVLRARPSAEDELLARQGIARCALSRRRIEEALAHSKAIDERFPAAPVVDERFDGGIGPRWLLSSPLSARVAAGRGDVELGAGASGGATALVQFIPWRGGPLLLRFDLRLADLEPGAALRLGLCAARSCGLGAEGAGAPERAAGAPERAAGDRLYAEIAVPDAALPADAAPPRALAALRAVAGGARAGRAQSPADAGLQLDTPYRVTIEWIPPLSRARIEIAERAAAALPGGRGAAASAGRVVWRAEIALAGPFADEPYVMGLLAPLDEPVGAAATVALEGAELRVPPDAAARAYPHEARPFTLAVLSANAALASGRPADALAGYRAATLADPFDDRGILGMGLAAREAGDLVLAARAFAAIVKTEPLARDLFRATADDVASRGTPLDLVVALESTLAVEPQDLARRAALDGARRRLCEAVEAVIEPGSGFSPDERLSRAELLARGGEPEKALAEIERARADVDRARAQGGGTSTAKPDTAQDARILIARARSLSAKGDAARAAIDWSRAKSLTPEDPAPFLGLGRLLLERALKAASGTGTGTGTGTHPGGATATASPEATSAEAALSRGLKLAPDAASLALDAPGPAEAPKPGRSALEPDPRAPLVIDGLAARAQARLLLGRAADARADADMIARLAPRDVRGPTLAALAAQALGKIDDARALVERAQRMGPVDPSLATAVGARK